MRINLRNVVGPAQAPAGAAVGVPGVPAQPPAGEFSAASLVDTIRNARAALGDGRGVLREIVGLKDDLEALGITFGPRAPPPNQEQSTPPTVQSMQSAPAAGTIVDASIAAAMSRPPPGALGLAAATSAAAVAPPTATAAAPPPIVDDAAAAQLRDECRELAKQITREKMMELLFGAGIYVMEGKGFTELSDVVVDYEAELRQLLDKIPLERIQAVFGQLVAKRPASDLPKVKAMMLAAIRSKKKDDDDSTAAPAPAVS